MSEPFYMVTFRAPLPRITKDGKPHEIAVAIGEIPTTVETPDILGPQFVAIRAALLMLKLPEPTYRRLSEGAYAYMGFISVHRDQIVSITYTSEPRTAHLPRL